VMTWRFGSATAKGKTTYPSKIDFHQISAGYGGHLWFTHTLASANSAKSCTVSKTPQLQVTGTWTPPLGITGLVTVYAAVPNYGADSPAAIYQVVTGTGHTPQDVIVDQNRGRNTWIDLGTFRLSAGAHVSLNNVDCSASGYDVAWDAMAFVPAASAAG